MAEITEEQRQAVVRDICAREGHTWVEVGNYSDLPWLVAWCARGCGAERKSPYGDASLPLELVISTLSALDPTCSTVSGIEIVTEPWKAGRDE